MKHYIFLTLILSVLLFGLKSNAQEIKGKVIDGKGQALVGATVYIDGTTIGDVSGLDGKFSFNVPKSTNAVLVCSYIGYKTFYLQDIDVSKFYQIVLKENIQELKEVKVYNNPYSREKMMSAFLREFIGTGKAAAKCEIANKEVIRFRYIKEEHTLKAYADEPIIITNNYLGYSLTYDLVEFKVEYYSKDLLATDVKLSYYAGTSIFKELNYKKRYTKNRMKAFNNSSLSFYRALANQELADYDYELFYKGFKVSPTNLFNSSKIQGFQYFEIKDSIKQKAFQKYRLHITILYKGKTQSQMFLYTPQFYVDGYGLSSHLDQIYFAGEISKKKVAMMLPANYKMK